MTNKPGTPIGESDPWWLVALLYAGLIVCALTIFAYAGYVLDRHAEQSGRIAACQKECVKC